MTFDVSGSRETVGSVCPLSEGRGGPSDESGLGFGVGVVSTGENAGGERVPVPVNQARTVLKGPGFLGGGVVARLLSPEQVEFGAPPWPIRRSGGRRGPDGGGSAFSVCRSPPAAFSAHFGVHQGACTRNPQISTCRKPLRPGNIWAQSQL